jgi:hypothetical protein
MAVKLYEKDPSKLTAADETLPAVSTGSDLRKVFSHHSILNRFMKIYHE